MSELSKALGADGPGRLFVAGTREYRVCSVTQKIKAEFEEWVEASLKASLHNSIAPLGDSDLTAGVMLKHAEKVAREHYRWGNEGWAEQLRSVRGTVRFLLMVMRPYEPGVEPDRARKITPEEVRDLISTHPKEVGLLIKELLEEGKSTAPVV